MFSKILFVSNIFSSVTLPSFSTHKMRNRVALTVIDSQDNILSESRGLEYTDQDLRCSHPIPLVGISSHYLKIRVTFCLCSV